MTETAEEVKTRLLAMLRKPAVASFVDLRVVEDRPLETPEEKLPEMPQDEPSPVPKTVGSIPKTFPAGTCQNCGNTLTELGGARRCAVCGWQEPLLIPGPGISRADYKSGEWRRNAR